MLEIHDKHQYIIDKLIYKFNVGDKVKIVKRGKGVGLEHINKIVTIKHRVYRYVQTFTPSYIIEECIGNCNVSWNGKTEPTYYSIGESSFELFVTKIIYPDN